jgi:hypothetical protein
MSLPAELAKLVPTLLHVILTSKNPQAAARAAVEAARLAGFDKAQKALKPRK